MVSVTLELLAKKSIECYNEGDVTNLFAKPITPVVKCLLTNKRKVVPPIISRHLNRDLLMDDPLRWAHSWLFVSLLK